MRVHSSVVLAAVLCLFSAVASADIARISPSQFDLGVEDFISIYGDNLTGTVETTVVFDGAIEVEPSLLSPEQLMVWVPTAVVLQEGQHTLVVRAVDGAGIRTYGPVSFTVSGPVIDPNAPPVLSLPEIVNGEATSLQGGVVTYEASASDADGPVPVTCSPPSGAIFPMGSTIAQCSASNAGGTTTGSFYVFVVDSQPPVVTVPANIVSDDPVVTFTASAVDAIDGSLPVTCSPASGSTFAQGTTQVRCTATDSHANSTTAAFLVTITGGPPALQLPGDITEEATGPNGAVVTFEATAADGETVTCTPASGSTFSIGTTQVSCSATNPAGTSTGTFNVTVMDTTPPEITAPSLLEVEATSAAGAVATFVVTAYDLVDGDVAVTCAPPSGSLFPMGTTDVFCSATDSRNNGNDTSFQVIVQDTTAPEVTSISANPGVLWPPNHEMVNITVSATVVDAVDPSPTWTIVSVSSNQPQNGLGDGDLPNDWVITGPNTVQLRSETAQGTVRIYTITIQTLDANGNVGTATVQVKVQNTKGSASLRR